MDGSQNHFVCGAKQLAGLELLYVQEEDDSPFSRSQDEVSEAEYDSEEDGDNEPED